MKADVSRFWVLYKENNDYEARNELIMHYAHMVKYAANRLAINLSSLVETDELISYGIEGLIDAVEKFDYNRNIKFETYAITRIRGSMIDGLRAMDWVPVSVRQKSKEIEKIIANLEMDLGRSASDQEIADQIGVSLDELASILKEISSTTIISIDDFIPGDNGDDNKKRIVDILQDDKIENALEMVEFTEVKELLGKAIGKLPEKEKKVVSLYYHEGLTLKEIGKVLNLSESRISQLHTKAVLRLRGSLSKKKNLLI